MGLGKLPEFLKFSKPRKLDFSVYKKQSKSVRDWVQDFVKDGEKYLNDPTEYTRNKLVIMVLIGERNLEEFKAENRELEKQVKRLENRIKNMEREM
jgi:ubiquinone biosynthesis protein UbiJ